MRFKKIPLFGQDSSPQHTSNILALIGTLTFWLFFLICMIFIKPKPQKPKFKEIQIVLSQDFTTQKTTPTKEDKSENQKESSKMQETQKTEEIVKPVQNEVPQIETSQVTETVTKAPETKNAVPNKTEPKTVQKTQAESKPAEQKAPEITKPKTAPITESKPVQKTESVQNAEPVEYAKSVEELMAEQMNSKKKTNDFNWDMFEDDLQEENIQD